MCYVCEFLPVFVVHDGFLVQRCARGRFMHKNWLVLVWLCVFPMSYRPLLARVEPRSILTTCPQTFVVAPDCWLSRPPASHGPRTTHNRNTEHTKCTGKSPFEVIYMHGLVRDGQGQKMSKTKGNVIDPIETIDKCVHACVRSWLPCRSGVCIHNTYGWRNLGTTPRRVMVCAHTHATFNLIKI